MKTKLGISVGLLGAATYFTGFFGGYVIAGILAGYILLVEENVWLKKTAVKAVALLIGFSLLSAVVNLIPNIFDFIETLIRIFDQYFVFEAEIFAVIDRLVSFVLTALNLVEKVVFIVLGLKALNQGTIKIPVIDNLVNKYMD